MTSPTLHIPTHPPDFQDHSVWVPLRQFAEYIRKSPRRVQQMCKSGEIMAFCVASFQDAGGKWWLRAK